MQNHYHYHNTVCTAEFTVTLVWPPDNKMTGNRKINIRHEVTFRRRAETFVLWVYLYTLTVAELPFPRGAAAMITHAQLEKSNCWESCQLSWVPQLLLMIYYRSAATFASRKTLSVESWRYTLMDENINWIIFLLHLPHTLSSLLLLVTRKPVAAWLSPDASSLSVVFIWG